jgi:pilus assembly protein Flp/PilA
MVVPPESSLATFDQTLPTFGMSGFFPIHTGETSMAKLVTATKKFIAAEEGATMVEYGVMVALIAAICVTVVAALGVKVNTAFSKTNAALP